MACYHGDISPGDAIDMITSKIIPSIREPIIRRYYKKIIGKELSSCEPNINSREITNLKKRLKL